MLSTEQYLERAKTVKSLIDNQVECSLFLQRLEKEEECSLFLQRLEKKEELTVKTLGYTQVTFLRGTVGHSHLMAALQAEICRLEDLICDIVRER